MAFDHQRKALSHEWYNKYHEWNCLLLRKNTYFVSKLKKKMSFKILIVEDQELYAEQLEMLVDKLGYEHIATVDNSTHALSMILKNVPDLILMDIHIQGSHDGIELAEMIHQSHLIPIIFITSLQDDETFQRANKIQAVHFLMKPFNDLQLQRIIEMTVSRLQNEDNNLKQNPPTEEWENDFLFQDHFYIKTRQKLDKVSINDVLFLEADGHHCWIHTSAKKFLVRMPMKELSNRLPKFFFIQTHRSCIVNIQKIQSVNLEESVIVFENTQAPLSKRNKEILLQKLNWI